MQNSTNLPSPNRSFFKFAILFAAAICLISAAFFVFNRFDEIKKEFSHDSAEFEEEENEAANIEEAVKWRRLSLVDEKGEIEKGALTKALAQLDTNLRSSPSNSLQRAGLSRANWVSRGPQNVGGRTRAVVINPANTNLIWAGAAGGGLWKSTNAGQGWTVINDFLPNLAVSSLAIDPNNSNIMYCGTGEGFFNGDAINGAGIYKSTDQGNTWTQLPNTVSWSSTDRISVAPGNGSVILASTAGGIRRSTDGGGTWTNVKAVQKSFFVAFDPTNGSKAVAQVLDYNFTTSQWFHDALYSTNGGVTWQTSNMHTTDFYSRIELTYLASNPNTVFVSHPVTGGAAVSKSTDGGATYTQVTTTPINEGGQMWYDNAIWVSPTDPNLVIVALVNLYKSTNGGATFTKISNGYLLTAQPHPDQHCIVPDPGFNGTTNKKVYNCNDGGIFRTDDITTAGQSSGWTSLNAGYQTSQYYGAAGNGTTGFIYGGLQDNGTLSLTSANANAVLSFGGDGGFAAVDQTNENYCYGEYITLQIHRSTNKGLSSSYITSGLTDAGTNANFIAPFILDPNDPNRLLAGGRSLWRSNNVKAATPSWTAIRAGGSDNISAIAVAKGNSNVVWTAQNDGKVYKTVNGSDTAPTWTTIDDNSAANPLPNRYPTRILIDPSDSNVVYVAFGGFSDGNLQRTTNGGQTWADVTGTGVNSLPFAPIRGVARNPTKPNWLYVGTEVGIFASEDGGATWQANNEGPASVSVDELVFMNNSSTLLAATHGRGVWTLRLGSSLYDFDVDNKADFSVFRPSNATWYLSRSSQGFAASPWGNSTDKPVPADYDGDGKTDVAVYRDGYWYILKSSDNLVSEISFGIAEDLPAPGDFDGDGKADISVFRPSNGVWYRINSSNNQVAANSWGSSGDKPVIGDFDGDGRADLCVYRPSNGVWYRINSADNQFAAVGFGAAEDLIVPADYDGDGKTDVAVFRPSTSNWYRLNSLDGSFAAVNWGAAGDKPVPADYDGDGKTDVAVYRSGYWYIIQSTNGQIGYGNFGAAGDFPIPNAFVR